MYFPHPAHLGQGIKFFLCFPMAIMQRSRIPLLVPLGLIVAMIFSGGCASIAGDYQIAEGSEQDRNYTSVAGNVDVGRSARIGNAKTVSGGIEIGEYSRTGTLSSVAGRIRVGANGKVDGSVRTIAGDIEIARRCTITGDVGTIAGRITVTDSVVKGGMTQTTGKLTLRGSQVAGTVYVEPPKNDTTEEATVDIGPNSEVGKVIVKQGARVHLRIHRSAKVGAVEGAEAEYYD